MERAIVFDSWSIDGKPMRFTVEIGDKRVHTIADLAPEDKKAFGVPKPGDIVWVVEIRRQHIIVGRGDVLGPSARRYLD
jgi:hypothetical protein